MKTTFKMLNNCLGYFRNISTYGNKIRFTLTRIFNSNDMRKSNESIFNQNHYKLHFRHHEEKKGGKKGGGKKGHHEEDEEGKPGYICAY